jgi:hypothetical protein
MIAEPLSTARVVTCLFHFDGYTHAGTSTSSLGALTSVPGPPSE